MRTMGNIRTWMTENKEITVALIAALGAIIIAVLNLSRSTSAPNGPPQVNVSGQAVTGPVQTGDHATVQTAGDGSAVHSGSGSQTVIQGVPVAEYAQLASKLGIAEAALKSFFKSRGQHDVAPEDWSAKLYEFAKTFKELEQSLVTPSDRDTAIPDARKQAKDAVEAGELDKADRFLADAEEDTHRNAAELARERGLLAKLRYELPAAAGHFRRAVDLTPAEDELARAENLNSLGIVNFALADFDQSEPAFAEALEIRERLLPSEHADIAVSLNNLAQLYQATNRLEEAEPLMERALTIDEVSFGPDHPDVAVDLNNLAQLYKVTNRLERAEPLMERAFDIMKTSLGESHPNTLVVSENLNGIRDELAGRSD